ncbi:MAG: hypothetical protein U9Q07_02785 [Planctomycetota bacterium]|nr:hypothetical protein [Planctomycetota bacterium]
MKTDAVRKILTLYRDRCADTERKSNYTAAVAQLAALEMEWERRNMNGKEAIALAEHVTDEIMQDSVLISGLFSGCVGVGLGPSQEDAHAARRELQDIIETALVEHISQQKETSRLQFISAVNRAIGYMSTIRKDRPVYEEGELMGHWQTVEWLDGLVEIAEELDALLEEADDVNHD